MKPAYRMITIANLDYIHPIRNYGPVSTPTAYASSTVYRLVQEGYSVYEHATADYPNALNKKIKLTISNFNDEKRFGVTETPPASKTKVTGTPASGMGKAVSAIAPGAPIPAPKDDKPAEEIRGANPVAAPIKTKLTKAERRAAARAAAEAEKKQQEEAVAEAVTEPEVTEAPVEEPITEDTTNNETTEPEGEIVSEPVE